MKRYKEGNFSYSAIRFYFQNKEELKNPKCFARVLLDRSPKYKIITLIESIDLILFVEVWIERKGEYNDKILKRPTEIIKAEDEIHIKTFAHHRIWQYDGKKLINLTA